MKIIKKISLSLCISLIFLNFWGCKDEKPLKSVSIDFPKIDLPDISGNQNNIDPADGKTRLIVFWATWCQPCLMEIPALKALSSDLDKKTFEVLGINVDEDDAISKALDIQKKYELNYKILMSNEALMEELGGVDVLPTSFLVNGQGKILRKWHGPQTKYRFEQEINKSIASK